MKGMSAGKCFSYQQQLRESAVLETLEKRDRAPTRRVVHQNKILNCNVRLELMMMKGVNCSVSVQRECSRQVVNERRRFFWLRVLSEVRRVVKQSATKPWRECRSFLFDWHLQICIRPFLMGTVWIRHSSHDFGCQSSHSVDLAGWQAKMASIEIRTPWRNAHKRIAKKEGNIYNNGALQQKYM